MIKHTKFFGILLCLCSCSLLEEIPVANYVYTTMKAGIINEPPKIYDSDFIDSFPYKSINAQLNNGTNALMVLSYIRDGYYEYISSDGIKLILKNGILVETIGLPNDFKRYPDPDLLNKILAEKKVQESFSGSFDFFNPRAFNLTSLSSFRSKKDEIIYNGTPLVVKIIEETIILSEIKRKFTFTYYIYDQKIIRAEYSTLYNPKISIFVIK